MRLSTLLALLVTGAAAPAQRTWTVNPPTDLTQLFANAAPGDIVILGPGSYVPFTLQKGLTVIGPATLQGLTGPVGPWDTTITVPAGQQARFVGLDFPPTQQPQYPVPLAGHRVAVTGDASFEDCGFGPGAPNSLTIASGNVVLHHCTVRGGPSLGGGFAMSGGYCAMSACTVIGNSAGILGVYPIQATPGALMDGGTLVAASCTFQGGHAAVSPYNGYLFPTPGVQTNAGTALAFLTDSVATGGNGTGGGTGNPGFGVVAISAAARVDVARCTLRGGSGPRGMSGPFFGNVQTTPTLVGMSIDHGFLLGQTSTATAIAGSSQQVLGIFATSHTTVTTPPHVFEPLFGLQTQAIVLAAAVPAPGAPVTAALAVPNVLALRAAGVWLQALQYDGAAAWRASAVVGGVVH